MADDKRSCEDRRVRDRRLGWLVSDWRRAYKWFSVQAAAVLAGLQVAYELLPAAQAYIPAGPFRWLMVAGLAAIIIGRLKAQGVKP